MKPQAIRSLRPSTTNGTAGSVAPITLRSGASRCARYHTPGAVRWRCGSFASSGAPVAVRLPATTHSFEPSAPVRGVLPQPAGTSSAKPRSASSEAA